MEKLDNKDFLRKPINTNHFFVINSRPHSYVIFLDLATNRELVFINEELASAREVYPSRAQRSLNFALEGTKGYDIENFTSDEYEKFNELYNMMVINS